ncbi:MAG: DUF2070 family protein [Candidatus Bathyarchaeia archaeon]
MKDLLHRENINLAVKHYSSLFYLPSIKILLLILFLINLLLGFLTSLLVCSRLSLLMLVAENALVRGILFGSIFFASALFSDYLANRLLLKRDIIFSDLKRVFFLSLFSGIFFVIFTIISLSFEYLQTGIYTKVLSLGLYVTLSFRLLVINATSFAGKYSKTIFGVLQPMLLLLLSNALVTIFRQEVLHFSILLYSLPFTLIFSVLSVWLFKKSLDVEGEKLLGIPSLETAKAFVANWTENVKGPFEEILERLSEERTVSVSALTFREKNTGKLKAMIIVPSIHPGPFKNVGSSLLPSIIKESLEREFQCIVSVPHGISGHELDLPSQAENEKIIKSLIFSLKGLQNFSSRATNFFMVEGNGAKVGCQVFDDCAFVTLTTSPETMEDLPSDLNDAIIKKALENGFSWAIVIDAHNSINGSFDMKRSVGSLKEVAYLALEKAAYLRHTAFSEIKVGAGCVLPRGLGLKDGMGPGGITAIVVEVNGVKAAYVTIDGNNMVSSLREKILSSLKDVGIDCGEVFTTDTHAVSAVVLNRRGYHPIGEAIDHKIIIDEVKKAVCEALKNMEVVEFSWCKIDIPGVKVIGERRVSELSLLTENVFRKAKKNSAIFVIFGALLATFFTKI